MYAPKNTEEKLRQRPHATYRSNGFEIFTRSGANDFLYTAHECGRCVHWVMKKRTKVLRFNLAKNIRTRAQSKTTPESQGRSWIYWKFRIASPLQKFLHLHVCVYNYSVSIIGFRYGSVMPVFEKSQCLSFFTWVLKDIETYTTSAASVWVGVNSRCF